MIMVPIAAGWILTARSGPFPAGLPVRIPATVPGCVHTDLLAAGLIPDPYLDRNELELLWIGRTAWRYQATFDATPAVPGEHLELVFAGVDTVATISLNGTELGVVANMHRTHRFDVARCLRETNTLTVDFAAQVDEAQARSTQLGPRVHANAHPYNAVRKMACNFGWDWGPDVTTAGLWQPVSLHRWQRARISGVRPLVSGISQTHDGESGSLTVHVGLVADAEVTVVVECGHVGARVRATGDTTVELEVPRIRRWWPRGYGDQPLSPVAVTVRHGETVLDTWQGRVGFRTVTVDQVPDLTGTSFTVLVNDRPVWVKGVNWIPDDCFLPRAVTPQRYRAALRHAMDAGVNLIRVWGGGIYETETFYDLCDQTGLLVWQDFLFACAAYSEDDPLRGEVIAEARENVARLARHPSLVIWNGNNENTWGHEEWDWESRLQGRTWGLGYYLDVLPGIVAELDPTRPYLDASPSSFGAGTPNAPEHGTVHIWDVWNQADYSTYRNYRPRFVAEFGYQAPPAWSTLTSAVHDHPLTPDSQGMQTHQKANDGNRKLVTGARGHLRIPAVYDEASMRDWHWAMQLQQARAVRYGIEHFRSLQPLCGGAVLWQLNDCWPVTSWAAVDGHGHRKPLWFALRDAYAPVLVTVQPRGDGLVVAVCNDTDAEQSDTLTLRRITMAGDPVAEWERPVRVDPRSTGTIPVPGRLRTATHPSRELLVAAFGDRAGVWFFAEDPELALPQTLPRAVATRSGDSVLVEVTATELLKDVALLVDQVDPGATVDDGLRTILPGQTHRFRVQTSEQASVDPDLFTRWPVLRSANQL